MNIHKLLCTILTAAMLLMLTGCDLSTLNAENLMRPPKASGDGAAIQEAMTELLGTQITLRYPRSGEYRSAVIRAELDNDGQEEAVAFYRQATESSGAHMVLLDTDGEGRWIVIGETDSTGGDIDRVLFGDLTGDGMQEIITGWSVYPGSSIITAHSYSGGTLSSLNVVDTAEETGTRSVAMYNEMTVGDFDDDGKDDILTAYINSADNSVTARLLCYKSGSGGVAEIGIAGHVPLSGAVATYLGSCSGQLTDEIFGLALDSLCRNGRYMTELVYWDKTAGCLVAPISSVDGFPDDSHTRTLPTLSCDIDTDGLIEFPIDSLLSGYTAESAEPLYVTTWCQMTDDGGWRKSIDTLIFSEQGYFLILRNAWKNTITAQRDDIANVTYFCTAAGGNHFANEVMRIKLFTLDEWETVERESVSILGTEVDTPHYIALATTDYYVYAVLIAADDYRIDMSYESVLGSFRLLDN
ncbi:MAG: hypothetical protein IJC18_03735 [Clostridia bacterium]|nr:hypothetical protein [Clostridia bacterium]